jgi:hypothetical protein
MKTLLFFICAMTAFSIPAWAQDSISVSTSTVDQGGRYEIIQPPFDRSTTFRLDRYSGTIHRLGTCPKDDSIGSKRCWKEMRVVDPGRPSAGRPGYQIVINGPLRLIMLLHIDSGKTWEYGLEPEDKWHPFVDCADRTSSTCLWRP